MTPARLTGPRLAVREVEAEDADGLPAVYGDAAATRHLGFEPHSREQVEAVVDRSIASA
ncbi:GNAT family N-acetyltransferase [Kitasatospora sp. NPDC008115]|uniref:GNAT family N-acetyltransferase n=1 Tax=Kitasatospora sp. NPDC008115 TaxID=3364022 RepID=UPI0036E21343